MYATERQQRIAGIVTDEGRASVTALSALFGVAQETIRRDLDQLQADGVLLRVHGGAVPAGRTSAAEPSLAKRLMIIWRRPSTCAASIITGRLI